WHPANGRTSWTYVFTPNTVGATTLRARAVDDSGNLGAASQAVSVTIAPSTLVSIAIAPANPTVTVGGTQQLTATGTYSDTTTKDRTNQVTGTSASTATAVVNAPGLATAEATGSTTISASLGSVTGSTGLTVVSGALTITTSSLPVATVGTAYSATLTGIGGTPPYTWSVVGGKPPDGPDLTPSPHARAISGTPPTTGTSPPPRPPPAR